MQPLLARLRSLRPERFDSATGRRRHRGVALAAGLALALFAGSGIAVAAVASASAHTPNVESNCTGVHVRALDYNADLDNTATVRITGPGGYDHTEYRTFKGNLDEWFTVPDSSLDWSYDVTIDALDDNDDDSQPGSVRWDYSQSGTTGGCATPDIGVAATTCIHAGDLTTVTATISPLDPTHSYEVSLTGTNSYSNGPTPVMTTTASWSDLTPGYDYTATLTDKTSGLSDSDTVHAIGCPGDASFELTPTQCTTVDGSGAFGVTVSGLVANRDYLLELVNTAGGTPLPVPFTASGTTFSYSFTTSPSGSYYVQVTDVADGTTKKSKTLTYLPCPGTPEIVLDPTACTTTDGTSDASLSSSADGLIPGRSYSIAIVDGSGTSVYSESLAPAASSTWSTTLTDLGPGTYTLTVTDTTDPGSSTFSSSASATIKPCPTQQKVDLTAVQCTVPGGSGSLTATVTDFSVGRNYTVALTQNGLPVAGQPASQDFDPVDATPGVFVYKGLVPGLSYRVVVQDVTPLAAAGSTAPQGTLPVAANDILLADCPGNPGVFLTQPTCTLLTVSTITVGVSKLIPGETYTVQVTSTKDGQPVPGVPAQQLTATQPTASLSFADLPVGREYRVTVANALSTLTATSTIFLTLCDLPTLAYTGASTMTPTLAGLGFLQFGLVLVGIGLVRRRSGAREA
ncbi:hypothetical protein BH09ACT5_BH09ACT5_14800 [soil metagenome]